MSFGCCTRSATLVPTKSHAPCSPSVLSSGVRRAVIRVSVRRRWHHRKVNPNGNPPTLRASHPGNTNATRHGVFSRTGRVLAPRAAEIAQAIMESAHVSGFDELGAQEIGSLIAMIEAIDLDLADRG